MVILALAPAGRTVGVDVEAAASADRIAAVSHYFLPEEQVYAACPGPAERRRRLLRVWTRKEAVMKADGRGLGLSLDAFSVLGEVAFGYHLRDLDLPDSHCGTLALDKSGPVLPVITRPWRA